MRQCADTSHQGLFGPSLHKTLQANRWMHGSSPRMTRCGPSFETPACGGLFRMRSLSRRILDPHGEEALAPSRTMRPNHEARRQSPQTVRAAIHVRAEINHFKAHSAPDHLRLQLGDMFLPALGFADTKSRGFTERLQLIVGRERTPRAEMHHRQTGVAELVIIHHRDGSLRRSFFRIVSKQRREMAPIPEPTTSLTSRSGARRMSGAKRYPLHVSYHHGSLKGRSSTLNDHALLG